MTDKDYLQIAKLYLDEGCNRIGNDRERAQTIAQAQAAASIAIAERIADLILATALIAKEWQKYNERVELRIEDGKTFGENGMIFRET